ncbi:MAG TPA: MoxR family ATPase [Nakamurella sp.]|jgi:MoxR-like ATPase|nr:MoxR family ATPase [Nakamurella sp.]
MTMTPEHATWFAQTFSQLVGNVGQAVVGKSRPISLAVTCLLSEGHLLLEDFPGTGKTSLARAMAATVQGAHSRIQFTPDLLPSDVTGVTIYDQASGRFEFHRGPIFADIVLADEINRASPKTQSALLEVMEESKVTVDGVSYEVGNPFMVIATQNPIEQAGTYRLPEAQLDRFLMKTSLGYPDHAATVEILGGRTTRSQVRVVPPMITTAAVVDMAELAGTVHTDPAVLDYVARIAEATRTAPETIVGVSVRGALALVRAARTWAAAHGRHFVVPDDVKDLVEPVLAHRIVLDAEAEFAGTTVPSVLGRILGEIAPPERRR